MLILKSWPLRDRIIITFWSVVYGFRYGIYSNIVNALWALKLAWRLLRGNIIVIDAQDSVSNGGYRYHTIAFSKRPVSNKHTYEDF
jgi:hypothetical protein